MSLAKRDTYLSPEREMVLPIVSNINSMAKLMILSGQQLVELQSALLDFSLLNSWLSQDDLRAIKRNRNGSSALINPFLYAQIGVQRNVETARVWWDIATQTQGAMLSAVRAYAPGKSGSSGARSQPARKTVTIPERRATATVLNFPDRRRSGS